MKTNEVIILGGGLARQNNDAIGLSVHSTQRVDRFVKYYEENKKAFTSREAFVLCSGGYGLLAAGIEAPSDGSREGTLTADELVRRGIPGRLIEVEDKSYSTVTNFTFSIKQGLLVPARYTADYRLGVVTHGDHFVRSADIARHVGIQQTEPAVVDRDLENKELVLRLLYRAALAGAVGPEATEKREWSLFQLLDKIRPAKQI